MTATCYYELFRPLFAYGAHLTLAATAWGDERPDLLMVQTDLNLMIDTIVAARRPADTVDFDNAWFAMCAWLDEKLSGILGSGHEEGYELLQRRYFNTLNAGEEFFTRLDDILEPAEPDETDPTARSEILKVYGAALELGFRGKFFRVEDQPPLEAYRRRTLEATMAANHADSGVNRMFVSYDEPERKTTVKPGMAFFWAAPVAVTALLYVIYRLLLSDLYSFMTG